MRALFARMIALFQPKPKPGFIVEIGEEGDWQAVAMTFPSHQAGVDYAKQHYSGAWQRNRVRVRPL